jgi:TusA-related sulfurtransferase
MPGQQPWGPPSIPNQQLWGPQPLNYGWQQPTIYPGQFQPQQIPPKKKKRLGLIIGLVCGAIVLCGVIGSLSSESSNSQNAPVAQSSTPTNTPTKVAQVVKPTATPTPTETPAQIEADYKSSTTSTTVTNLDKDGSADQGNEVHFVCKILAFVKDSTGQTAGANVSDTGSYSTSVVQVAFAAGTDITQLNEGDILEVWGTDEGVFSGANAFGATVQEVEITAQYMKDQTTNYQVSVHQDPLAVSRSVDQT